ncbi:MAG: hypothetical protein U5K71_00235 [Gracilimonas sp.]|nr:hypothetical protein [Gracilimonas sp.]
MINCHLSDPTTYTIIAKDYFGNTSTAHVTLINDNATSATSSNTMISNWLTPEEWYWSENWFSPDQIETLTFEELNGLKINADHKLISDVTGMKEFEFLRLQPDSTYKIDSRDISLRLRFQPTTFFDTLTVATTRFEDVEGSTVISILPGNTPLKKDFMIEYYMGDHFEAGKNYGFYRIDPEDEDLSYVDSKLIGKTLLGFPSEFGNFKIIADDIPPRLSDLRLIRTDYGKWFATITATDELSGIEFSSAVFVVNGVRGIAEYDYEEELLRYYHPDFTLKSENTIKISVKDKAGNEIELYDTITLTGR